MENRNVERIATIIFVIVLVLVIGLLIFLAVNKMRNEDHWEPEMDTETIESEETASDSIWPTLAKAEGYAMIFPEISFDDMLEQLYRYYFLNGCGESADVYTIIGHYVFDDGHIEFFVRNAGGNLAMTVWNPDTKELTVDESLYTDGDVFNAGHVDGEPAKETEETTMPETKETAAPETKENPDNQPEETAPAEK